jgi:hypothetical protein
MTRFWTIPELFLGVLILLFSVNGTALGQEVPQFSYERLDVIEGTGSTATDLVDLDNDGDLDYLTSNKSTNESFWFENRGEDGWARHFVGKSSVYDGGIAWDVNGDGWLDYTVGSTVLINPGNPKYHHWTILDDVLDNERSHDHVPADIDGDGSPELVTVSDSEGINWFDVPDDPTERWPKHQVVPSTEAFETHGGVAPNGVGDVDGDGDNDIVAINSWWENVDGSGTSWERHQNLDFGQAGNWGYAVRTWLEDFDGDGDLDVVMSECDVEDGRVALFLNEDGEGGRWDRHVLKEQGGQHDFHTLAVGDVDADGDLDVIVGGANLGAAPYETLVFENLSGAEGNGVPDQWKEHVICVGHENHEGVIGDIDGDGDLDMMAKEFDHFPNRHYILRNLSVE